MDGTLYDDVRYPSTTFPQTHPDRLAVLASLHGLNPAPVERCRVLEVGCGDGSNLIPMAFGLPESEFVGIDLAQTAIDRGRETIEALGLRNVALRHQDLRAFAQGTAQEAPFDYVIAHGVYSWVPDDVREALLELYRCRLAPHGVAYVSYNAYPGSRVRDMVREMLLYHVAGTEDSQTVMGRAQGLARLLADAMPATESLASIRDELRAVAARDPAVVFHDELSPVNQPYYFYELVDRVGAHGLRYLAEADFTEMTPRGFSPAIVEILQAVEQERGRVAREQYLDFLKARRFRQTLLCHADAGPDRGPEPDDVRRFSVASPIRPASATPDLRSGVVEEFQGPTRGALKLDLPIAKAALVELGVVWPRRVPFAELCDAATARLADAGLSGEQGDDQTAVLATVLFEAFAAGVVQLHAYLPALALEPGERPTASPLARLAIERDEALPIPTLLHTHLQVDDPLARQTIRLLDGTRDRAALVAGLRRWVSEQTEAGASTSASPHVTIDAAALDEKLRDLARLGLLVS